MTTVKADDRRRVQIPGIKAGQVFALEDHGGTVTLTPLKKAEPRTITGRLVRRHGRLMLDVPKGLELAPGPIPREVPQ